MLRKRLCGRKCKEYRKRINYKWKDLLNKQHYNLMVLCQSMRIKIERNLIITSLLLLHTQALESMNPSRLLNKGYLKVIKEIKL